MQRLNQDDWDAVQQTASTPALGMIPPEGAVIRQHIRVNGTLSTTWEIPEKSHSHAPCDLCGFRGLVELTDDNGYEFSYACSCVHGSKWSHATKQLTAEQFKLLLTLRNGSKPIPLQAVKAQPVPDPDEDLPF
ncbi:MAG: hypothetical protein HC924_18855 [Synechococcaceae cyanobacterium SM2_3_2]|nr:hypothetical protein [Synechococcaceae cyanobacterium SM2_3_2]